MRILSLVAVLLAILYPASPVRAADEEATNVFLQGTFDDFDGDLPTGWRA